MTFYMWSQSNIRGRFVPIASSILVQAPSIEEARSYATTAWGIDFDDRCVCCGYRWDFQGDDNAAIVDWVAVAALGETRHGPNVAPNGQRLPMVLYGSSDPSFNKELLEHLG